MWNVSKRGYEEEYQEERILFHDSERHGHSYGHKASMAVGATVQSKSN